MKIICAHCQKKADKPLGEVNRAKNRNAPLYCNRLCAGFGRRKPKLPEVQRRMLKAEYDKKRRSELGLEYLSYKRKRYHETRTPRTRELERICRSKRKEKHLEYCRRPDYRIKKKKYDRMYKAIENYGEEYGPCMALVLDVRDECLSRMSDYDIRRANGTFAKTQQRRRDYERLISNHA